MKKLSKKKWIEIEIGDFNDCYGTNFYRWQSFYEHMEETFPDDDTASYAIYKRWHEIVTSPLHEALNE